jgi:hypothetical protein
MADVPNEETPDAPDLDPVDLDPDLAAVLDAAPEEVLGDLADVDAIVGDASAVLEGLDSEVPELEELAEAKANAPAPDLSAWSKPKFAAERIDVSKDAHASSATPAERIALVVMPVLILGAFVAIALLLL